MSTIQELKSLHNNRKSFAEQAGFKSISEISHLKEQDIVELATRWPDVAAQLVLELAAEIRRLTARNNVLKQEVKKTDLNDDIPVLV